MTLAGVKTKIACSKDVSALTDIRRLLKNEFAFDGYMEDGKEDRDMGMSCRYNLCFAIGNTMCKLRL